MSSDGIQHAPKPQALFDLVARMTCKPGWEITLLSDHDRGQGSRGLTLLIAVTGPNAYAPEHDITVHHYMIPPPAAFDERAWKRWLFDQCLLVEQHETAEWFQIDGARPFAPHHWPGADPYVIHETTPEEANLDSRGNVVHPTEN